MKLGIIGNEITCKVVTVGVAKGDKVCGWSIGVSTCENHVE